jgi:hypothetical protein
MLLVSLLPGFLCFLLLFLSVNYLLAVLVFELRASHLLGRVLPLEPHLLQPFSVFALVNVRIGPHVFCWGGGML